MPKEVEMKLTCVDDANPIFVRDRKLIQKTPFLNRAAYSQDKKWTTKSTKFAAPIRIPYTKAAIEFVLEYSLKYSDPRVGDVNTKLIEYEAAYEKSLDDLVEIMNCTSFLECPTFNHSLGFVVARKLDKKNQDEVVEFFGGDVEVEVVATDESNNESNEDKDAKFKRYLSFL
ncbi:hypothetical protein CAEBREN_20918 [Caenorhabditis brenneri]|uniref:SKP1 component dimerisation domain-containing protein n=1 Tax=Caenorhabditis brenneri TaxID=135651 RepID=G0P2H4_CAEBE|nr:hypothetical protein CAEBREN_20918 [Caenorhabditis brenneri]